MIRTSIRFNHKHIILRGNFHIRTEAHVIPINTPIRWFVTHGLSSGSTTVILFWIFRPWILGWCFVGQACYGGDTWYAICVCGDYLAVLKDSFHPGECSGNSTILDKFVCSCVCCIYQLEDNTMTAVFSWKLRHDTVPRHNTKIKKETLPSVYGRGVESITPIGCTAGRTTGSLTVADAKIVIQPT